MKTRFDLIPFAAIGEIADALAYGAEKYEDNNWCRGTNWGRYFAAMCRHVFAWWSGEDTDSESGYSHLAHAGCCLLFLMEYQRNGWGTDDRFTGPDGERFTKDDGIVQQGCDVYGSPSHACGVLCADADPAGGDRGGARAVDETPLLVAHGCA